MHEDIIFEGDDADDNDLEPVVINKTKYAEIYNNINSIIYCPTDRRLECERTTITNNNEHIFATKDIKIEITNESITFRAQNNYMEGQLFYILNSTYDKTNIVKIKCYLRNYIYLFVELNLISQYNDTMIEFVSNTGINDYDIFIYLENILVLKKTVNESDIKILSKKNNSNILNFDLGWSNAFLLFNTNRFTYALKKRLNHQRYLLNMIKN
ncbi:hypothetical protein HZS_7683, partial [Henneguya salminicola]